MNQVIIFPTDTVYGIGTGLLNKEGIKKIYEIKDIFEKSEELEKNLQVLQSQFLYVYEVQYSLKLIL